MVQQSPISYEELLRFYEEAGVDCALSETPVNQFARTAALQETAKPAFNVPQPPKPTPQSERPKAAIPNDAQVSNALNMALAAKTLDELRDALLHFDGCALKFTAKNTCFADGTAGAPLMLVGEAPGRDEDMQGLPFVGRSGQLLNRMLQAIGLKRDDVYIANTIPWRPPGNRTPTPLETELCRPFIDRQIELANPKLLVALGGPAAQSLTSEKQGILRLRGNWKTYVTSNGTEIPVMPTLHPAYLLRTPAQKKYAWNDFLEIKMKLRAMNLLP